MCSRTDLIPSSVKVTVATFGSKLHGHVFAGLGFSLSGKPCSESCVSTLHCSTSAMETRYLRYLEDTVMRKTYSQKSDSSLIESDLELWAHLLALVLLAAAL